MIAPLGYGTNLHSAERVDDIVNALRRFSGPLRRELGWDRLGVDLRLGHAALQEDLSSLRRALDHEGLSAHTLNGFPLMPFQAEVVKANAYMPDWSTNERHDDSDRLLTAALLLSDDPVVTISTSPGSWRGFGPRANHPATVAAAWGRWAAQAFLSRQNNGRRVILCPEPEPGCTLTTVADTVWFWSGPLAEFGMSAAADLLEGDLRVARQALDEHLGLCLDACHLAVMGEDPVMAVAALQAAGVPIAKCQVTACLEADATNPQAVAALLAMAEPRFLHQSCLQTARGSSWLTDDLPEVPAAIARLPDATRIRSHFHIPLHQPPVAPLCSTVAEAALCVAAACTAGCQHFAVETYTWSILGSEFDSFVGTAAELRWLRAALDS